MQRVVLWREYHAQLLPLSLFYIASVWRGSFWRRSWQSGRSILLLPLRIGTCASPTGVSDPVVVWRHFSLSSEVVRSLKRWISKASLMLWGLVGKQLALSARGRCRGSLGFASQWSGHRGVHRGCDGGCRRQSFLRRWQFSSLCILSKRSHLDRCI